MIDHFENLIDTYLYLDNEHNPFSWLSTDVFYKVRLL